MNALSLGGLMIGKVPRVVGTLSSLDALNSFPLSDEERCDIAEVRLDLIGHQANWIVGSKAIESSGTPVILTVRTVAEGGKWFGPEEERLAIFEKSVSLLSAIDVEFTSGLAPKLFAMVKRLSKCLIVSYHDFNQTPEFGKLEDVISEASKQASIVKITTMVKSEADIQVLQKLLGKDWGVPLCVMGMGSLGTQTRLSFPRLGSALTYGYLDTPSAPGQLSARTLVETLRNKPA